jgi:diguanylate cyclase (GGDEF)-like protein/PAS domain S-box-containing protein
MIKAMGEENTSARVLIVDDEPVQLASLSELVTLSGYQAEVASSGREAIDYLTDDAFDIMLLDLKMPDMSGYSVLDYVRDNSIEVKTVVVSGESNFDAVTTALRRGAHDFIKKPYVADELLSTIENTAQSMMLERTNTIIQRKLGDSEYLHRFIVENSPDMVFMLDVDGNFTFLNDTVFTLLGYEKSELTGKHYSTIVAPESREQARYVFMERRSGDRKSRHVELKLRCKDTAVYRYFDTSSMSVDLTDSKSSDMEARVKGTYGVARDITERKQAAELINFQAYHDLLTRLPNRTLLEDRLTLAITQASRNKQKLAVMFLDLDRFKWVNDTLGHAIGDRLLQSVSNRLGNCLRKGDTLARFGGDEFALVLPQIQSQDDAAIIAEKIINELKEPFEVDNHELYVTSSIGIGVYPEAGETMDALIQSADVAMYYIKERGKNGYQFFDEEMSSLTDSRLVLERELRKALNENQLIVCYQPQVTAQSGTVVGFEALVRWEHPEKGLIFPGDFIPVAEETGLIIQLGNYVMETACADLRRWRKQGLEDMRVSINFSALQLDQDDFIDNIVDILDRYDIPGHCFELEITENVIMRDMVHVTQKLRRLSRLGITIAIDDFGTGYSSLSYLQQFPINTLKIDKSFVNSINVSEGGTSIVDAIVAMAKGLRLNLIAEGVENLGQLDYLKDLGCHEIQGFLFGKAENAEATQKMLLASNDVGYLEEIAGP